MFVAPLSPSVPAVNMWCAYTAHPNNPDASVGNIQ